MDITADQAEFFKTLGEKSDGGILRGDYTSADAQYVVTQDSARYTPAQHTLWRQLYQRQV